MRDIMDRNFFLTIFNDFVEHCYMQLRIYFDSKFTYVSVSEYLPETVPYNAIQYTCSLVSDTTIIALYSVVNCSIARQISIHRQLSSAKTHTNNAAPLSKRTQMRGWEGKSFPYRGVLVDENIAVIPFFNGITNKKYPLNG